MNKSNVKYVEDNISIDRRVFHQDFDDVDYEPHVVDDSNEEEREKYGY